MQFDVMITSLPVEVLLYKESSPKKGISLCYNHTNFVKKDVKAIQKSQRFIRHPVIGNEVRLCIKKFVEDYINVIKWFAVFHDEISNGRFLKMQ